MAARGSQGREGSPWEPCGAQLYSAYLIWEMDSRMCSLCGNALPLPRSYMSRMCITTETTKETRKGIKGNRTWEGQIHFLKTTTFLSLFVYFRNKGTQGKTVFENRRAATRAVDTRSTCLARARLQRFDLQHCKSNKYINKQLHIIFLGLPCKTGSSSRRSTRLFFSQFLPVICPPGALKLGLSSQPFSPRAQLFSFLLPTKPLPPPSKNNLYTNFVLIPFRHYSDQLPLKIPIKWE